MANKNKIDNTRQKMETCVEKILNCNKVELRKISSKFYKLYLVHNLFSQINYIDCGLFIIVNTKFIIDYTILNNLYKNTDILITIDATKLVTLKKITTKKNKQLMDPLNMIQLRKSVFRLLANLLKYKIKN